MKKILAISMMFFWVSGSISLAGDIFPGTEDGARQLLEKFLDPGADRAAMSARLKPSPDDYEAYFVGDAAARARGVYEPAWERGYMEIGPKEGQTEVLLWATTTDNRAEIERNFPGGYQKILDLIQPGHLIVRFKFVKPGQTMGMAYDGLVYINDHWVIFPKPWRALDTDS